MKSRFAQAVLLSTVFASVFTFASAASAAPCIYGNSSDGPSSFPSDAPSGPTVDSVDASNSSFTTNSSFADSSSTTSSTTVDGQSDFNQVSVLAVLATIGVVGAGIVGGILMLKARRARNLEASRTESSSFELLPADAFATSDFAIAVPPEALLSLKWVEDAEEHDQDAAFLVKK